jgi:hypothetical protein
MIVPTEIFSARRVRWMLHRHDYDPRPRPGRYRRDWWQSDRGISAFWREILKYVYYRVRY